MSEYHQILELRDLFEYWSDEHSDLTLWRLKHYVRCEFRPNSLLQEHLARELYDLIVDLERGRILEKTEDMMGGVVEKIEDDQELLETYKKWTNIDRIIAKEEHERKNHR